MQTPPVVRSTGTDSTDLERRWMTFGLLAMLGGGAMVGPAEALPRGYKKDFAALNRTLQKYGLGIAGTEGAGSEGDSIDLTTHPLVRTRYTSTIELPNDFGAIIPCVRTSYADEVAVFDHLMPSERTGEIVPCFQTVIRHGHDDPTIIPCISEHYDALGQSVLMRAAVVHEHEAVALTIRDAIGPQDTPAALALNAEWDEHGQVHGATLAIGNQLTAREVPFRITVAGRTYELKGGELVLQ